MKTNKSHLILKKAYARLKKTNSKFSIRALALKIGVSHVFMMKLLKGTASIPDKKISTLIKVLGLDDLSQGELKEAILYDAVKEKIKAFPNLSQNKKSPSENYEEFPLHHLSILTEWYYLPILDLLTCDFSPKSCENIAQILGIKEYEVLAALEKMKDLGLASLEDAEWKKTNLKMRFPANIPSEITKNYYKKILEKAIKEVSNSNSERYQKRSITNLSVAVNPENIQKAKEKLQACLYEIANDASEGECKEVYFLTTCFYPLSQK